MCVGGPVGEEDSIAGVNEGVGDVQSVLVAGVVLTVPTFTTEELTLEGVSMCVVCTSTGLELMERVRT